MNKILTLIIPTYNMEKYLNKCLTSLIINDDELMKQLEILVIIDGAKDRSSEIAHTYECKYPNTFRVIDKENGNYGSCINRGLKEATGKYIKILDADDYFNTSNFTQYIKFLNENDADLIISDFQIVNENYEVTKTITFNLQHSQTLYFSDIYKDVSIKNLQMHATTYKKEIFSSLNYKQTEGISYTDQEWMFHPMSNIKKVIYYNRSVYNYLIGREGQTMDPQIISKQISHTILGIKNMLDIYNKILDKSIEVQEYLDYRLCLRVNYVYNHYLLKENDTDSTILNEFDNHIKVHSPYFYHKVNDNNKILIFQHIKYWRNKSYILFKLSRIIYKLLS